MLLINGRATQWSFKVHGAEWTSGSWSFIASLKLRSDWRTRARTHATTWRASTDKHVRKWNPDDRPRRCCKTKRTLNARKAHTRPLALGSHTLESPQHFVPPQRPERVSLFKSRWTRVSVRWTRGCGAVRLACCWSQELVILMWDLTLRIKRPLMSLSWSGHHAWFLMLRPLHS